MALVYSFAPVPHDMLRAGLAFILRFRTGMPPTVVPPASRKTMPPSFHRADALVGIWQCDESGRLICTWRNALQ